MSRPSPAATWSLDRELVLTRVFDASPARVFQAWTDPAQLAAWFGPEGHSVTVKDGRFVAGGLVRFDMRGPQGQVWPSRFTLLEVREPSLLVFDHGSDVDDDPGAFRVTVTFEPQSDGKTVLTLRQWHPTKEQRDRVLGFGAVELGLQTLAKLGAHLASRR